MTQTVGEFLRKTREERRISLEQVAQATRVRLPYLTAIENDEPENLPSTVQARGFIRLYASFLNLPAQPLLDSWGGKQFSPEALSAAVPVIETQSTPKIDQQPVEPTPPLPLPARVVENQSAPSASTAAELPAVSVSEAPAPAEPAEWRVIFKGIGDTLRDRRESLTLSIADIERFTRLKAWYIQALEEARFEDLPSFVQGRGMLSNYAEFLDLDDEGLLLRYAEALQSRRLELAGTRPSAAGKRPSRPVGTARTARQPGWRHFLTLDMVMGGSLFVVLIGFVLWGAVRVINLQRQEAAPTLASVSDILMTPNADLSTPTPDMTASPTPRIAVANTLPPAEAGVENTAAPTNIVVPSPGSAAISVYIVATQRAWMRVTVDTTIAFEGRTVPGVAYPFNGRDSIQLLTGNAAALQVVYNQNNLGTLGKTGEVVNITFTREGTVVPTEIPTTTPTPTQTASPTRQPTKSVVTPSVTPYVP